MDVKGVAVVGGARVLALLDSLLVALQAVLASLWQTVLLMLGMQNRERIEQLRRGLREATSYKDWKRCADELDKLHGNDKWKLDPRSDAYDSVLISKRMEMLRKLRTERNVWGLIFVLRAGLSRNIGGIGNAELFEHSLTGTKVLIEEYMEEVNQCLLFIARSPPTQDCSLASKIDFFASLRRVYGRSALLLSGGATLGMYHLGVIKALFQQGVLPRIFSGSSAGSLIASLVCTRTDEELPSMFDLTNISLDAIERRGEGTARRRVTRLLKTGYLFDIKVLQECVRENAGDVTFLEAYNRTRRVLNITVSSSTVYELPRLLNYLTAPNVLIWSAASASCAIPGLYQPVPLMAKTKHGDIVPWNPPGTHWVDGSIENDLPMARLSEQFNVNHFIVSQVNPHVIPFLQQSDKGVHKKGVLSTVKYIVNSEVQHRLGQLFDLGVFPHAVTRAFYWTRSLLNQTYTGDITIVPPVAGSDFLKLMKNPVINDVRINVLKSERATWEKLAIIKMHFQTEKMLDLILYQLRVHQLEKVGRQYRPIDFALALDPLSDAKHNANENDAASSRSSSLESIGVDPTFHPSPTTAVAEEAHPPSDAEASAARPRVFNRSFSLNNMMTFLPTVKTSSAL